jgi:hypothetical protein
MDKVVAANGVTVAVAPKGEDVKVIAAEADAGRQGQRAAVDEVTAVGVDKVGEARGAADAREDDDVLLRVVELLQHPVEGGQDGEIAATGTPSGMVGGQQLPGQRGTGGVGGRGGKDGGGHGV